MKKTTPPSSHSIFYLEDHPTALDKLTRCLQHFGPWKVTGENDVERALEIFQTREFDLYLLDEVLSYHHPSNSMVGSQVFQKLKRFTTYRPFSPVVFFSQTVELDSLRQFGHGSDAWMRTHDYYMMRRLDGDLQRISDSLLEIIDYHRENLP
jgi:CheY-like chemotaxis protein